MTAPSPIPGYRPGEEWALITNTLSGRRTWYGRAMPHSTAEARAGDEWQPDTQPLYIDGLDTYELIPFR